MTVDTSYSIGGSSGTGYCDAAIYVEGHPTDMCFNGNSGYAGYLSVMSKTNSGNTVITVFEFPFSYMEPEVASVINIDGFPRDIISPSFGDYLIVLTSD